MQFLGLLRKLCRTLTAKPRVWRACVLGSRQPPDLPVECAQEGHTVFATKEEADTGAGRAWVPGVGGWLPLDECPCHNCF